MRLSVLTRRAKSRRVAALRVPRADVQMALDRLRSWALTREVPIDSALSWEFGDESTDVEARCPIPASVEVHPDTGIKVERVPSRYEAVVSVKDGDADPSDVATALQAWAEDNGYVTTGAPEVFTYPGNSPDFEVALPLKRRPRQLFIDVHKSVS